MEKNEIWPPREFFQELRKLCANFNAQICGHELGLSFFICGYGVYHTSEDYSSAIKNIDEIELD